MCPEKIYPSTSTDAGYVIPNRQNFERELTRVNNCFSKVHAELKQYWSDAKRDEINKIKSDLADFKKQYYACSEEDNKLSQYLKDLQNEHQTKQREMHELEDNDLIYKDLASARQKLVQVEERYNKRNFSSMREEQLQVNEVNRIKRNIQKLAKYEPLVEQRKTLEASMKNDRQKIREIRQKMRLFRDKIQYCRKQINDNHQNFVKLKELLTDLKTEKRNLIEKYNDEREAYNDWMKSNKPRLSSTHPSASLQDQQVEPLDLFHIQKNNCKRLINYLEKLSSIDLREIDGTVDTNNFNNNINTNNNTSSNSNNSSNNNPNCNGNVQSTDSDSAEDLPPSFKHFNIKSSQKQSSSIQRSLKKASKRHAMPLSHGIDYIKLFNDINVHPPKTYSDAEGVLKEVREALQFYEDQTTFTSFDDFSCVSPIFSVAGSEGFGSAYTSPRSLSSCSLANKGCEENQISCDSNSSWNSNV